MSERKQVREVFEKYPLKKAFAVVVSWAFTSKAERRKHLRRFLQENEIDRLIEEGILDGNLRQHDIVREKKKLDRRAVELYEYFKEKYREHLGMEYITNRKPEHEVQRLAMVIWQLDSPEPVEEIKNAMDEYFLDRNVFLKQNGYPLHLFLSRLNKYLQGRETAPAFFEEEEE